MNQGILAVVLALVTSVSARADAPAGRADPAGNNAPPGARYLELRIYDVASGKLEAVLERFRDTVDPLRRRHGIRVEGYWQTEGATPQNFIYLMSADTREELAAREKEFAADPEFKAGYAESQRRHGVTVDKIVALPLAGEPVAGRGGPAGAARTFELRIYAVLPGKLDAFASRWRDHATRIYERHGLSSVGSWTALRQADAPGDRFVVLLAADSPGALDQGIKAFHADPEWQRIERDTEKDGKLREGVQAFGMTPAEFSKLK